MQLNVFQKMVFLSLPAISLVLVVIAVGCGKQSRELNPITGKVTYQGKPLQYGSVTIEHNSGQPATAAIQRDGTFVMATLGEGDGVIMGKHRVRVACYEGQNPDNKIDPGQPVTLGKALIPDRYSAFDSSNLSIDVHPGANEPFILNLTP